MNSVEGLKHYFLAQSTVQTYKVPLNHKFSLDWSLKQID
jgi:hypothetical protein